MTVVKYVLMVKARGNIASYAVEGYPTLVGAIARAAKEVAKGEHVARAGFEIERVETIRTIVNPADYAF